MTMKTTLQLAGMLCAALLAPAAARAATIYGNISDVTGTGYATNITFRPISAPLEVNQTLYVRTDVTNLTSATGNFTNTLVAGDYQMFIGRNPRNSVVIGVPDDNGLYNFTTLIETTLTYPYSSPPAARTLISGLTDVTLGATIADGDGLVYNTNTARWTNSPLAGGGGFNLSTNPALATLSSNNAVNLTNFPGAPANATEAALRGITNAIHIVNIPGAADGIGTALSPRNATNSTVFDSILSNAPNGTVIKLGPQLFWTKGAAATGRARFWGTQNEFGIEGQNGTILRLDPTNNTSASSIVAVYLGTAGSGATSNYFVRNIAVELNPYSFPTNIALQGIQLYGDGLEITGNKLSGMRGRLVNGGAEAFGIVVDDAGSSTATLPRVISRNYVGDPDTNTTDTTSAIYGVRAAVINNTVDDTNTYAITLGSGSSYAGNRVLNSRCAFWADTAPVSNTVAVANYAKASQGTLTLNPSSGVFNGITFSGNILHGKGHVVFLVGNGGTISNVNFSNNRLIGDAGNSSVLNLQAVHNSSFVNNTMSTGLVSVVGATNTIFQNNRFLDGTAATTNSFYGGLFVNGGLDADYIQNTRLTNIASIDLTTGGYLHMNGGGNGAEFRSATSLRPSVLFDSFSGNDIALRTEFIFATNSIAGIMIQRPANTNQLEIKLGDNSAFGDLWVANLYTNGVQVTGGSGGGSGTMYPTNVGAAGNIAVWGGNSNAISFTNAITADILLSAPTNRLLITGSDSYVRGAAPHPDHFDWNTNGFAIKSGALVTNPVIDAAIITNAAVVTNGGRLNVTNGGIANFSHGTLIVPGSFTFSNTTTRLRAATDTAIYIAPAGTDRMALGGAAANSAVFFNNNVSGINGLYWNTTGLDANTLTIGGSGNNAMRVSSFETNNHRGLLFNATNSAANGGTNWVMFTTQTTNASAGGQTTNLVLYFTGPDGIVRRGTISVSTAQ